MRNIKFKYLLLFIVLSFSSFAQDIKLKKGEIIVDDSIWLNYRDCGAFESTCSLLNLKNEEIIFIKFATVQDDDAVSLSNLKGTVGYVQISFLGLKKKIEIQKRQKDCIKILYNSKVVNIDGSLNEEKVDLLFEKYGKGFSNRY